MIIELTRKHAVLFTLLLAIGMWGLWEIFNRSPVLVHMPRSGWVFFFMMAPGSAFLSTVIIMELFQVLAKMEPESEPKRGLFFRVSTVVLTLISVILLVAILALMKNL